MASRSQQLAAQTTSAKPATQAIPYSIGSAVSSDGTRIGFRRLGRGPSVVIVHGAVESAGSHIELAEALADDFKVHLLDRRGRGLSGPYAPGHSISQDVDDVGAVVDATGAEAIFGVSSGGAIALQVALELPSVRKVAVYEPALVADPATFAARVARYDREVAEGRVADSLVTAMQITEMGPRIFRLIPRPVMARMTASMLSKEDREAAPGTVTMRALAPTLHYDFEAVFDASGRIHDFAGIPAEVLLLGGSKSPAYLRSALDRLEGIVHGARRVEFPGLGHGGSGNAAWGGRPGVVAAELRRFFA